MSKLISFTDIFNDFLYRLNFWWTWYLCGKLFFPLWVNKTLIEALTKIKSYVDYGAFSPVQVAATAALNGSQQCVEEIRQIYKKRRDVLIESFGRAGWVIPKPKASMFVWAPIPPKFIKLGSMKFAKKLMTNADVAVAPGLAFGNNGEGFVRIGLVENTQRIRQAAKNIKKFLS